MTTDETVDVACSGLRELHVASTSWSGTGPGAAVAALPHLQSLGMRLCDAADLQVGLTSPTASGVLATVPRLERS